MNSFWSITRTQDWVFKSMYNFQYRFWSSCQLYYFFSNLLEIRENTSLYCFNGRSISFKRYALHNLLSLLWKHTLMTNQDVYKFHGGFSFLVVVFWMRKREPLLFFSFTNSSVHRKCLIPKLHCSMHYRH